MSFWRSAALAAAVVVVLTVVLAVALVFAGVCRLAAYNKRYSTVRAPRCRVSDAYPLLKTGDLLLFVATTHAPANSVLTQTFHSHAGLLVREGDLVYVSEAQPGLELMPAPGGGPDLRMSRGASLNPLLTRLKYYTGDCYLLRLSRALGPGREEALKRRAEQLARERYPYPTWPQIFLGLLGRPTASRHCFQHVAHLLDGAGLTPRTAPLCEAGFVGVCPEVCGLAGRPLTGGRSYGEPVELIYDVDAAPL